MVAYPGRLPSRFPEGTKFVVEGRGGVFARFIELPDGTQYSLPDEGKTERRLRARRPTRRR
jgi:hypothetical protein